VEPKIEADVEKRRRSIRMKNRNYALPGLYFVTICAHERRCVLGQVVNAGFAPSALGLIARECWVSIPEHFAGVMLHEFVVMPNHIHGLIAIMPSSPCRGAASLRPSARGNDERCRSRFPGGNRAVVQDHRRKEGTQTAGMEWPSVAAELFRASVARREGIFRCKQIHRGKSHEVGVGSGESTGKPH
jgi:REP element-mobilizing transposase RayT